MDDKSPPCQYDDDFWKSVTYIAEMRESATPGLSAVRFVSRKDIDGQIRSKTEKCKGLIEGKPLKVSNAQENESKKKIKLVPNCVTKLISLEFNSQRQSWHYGKHANTLSSFHVVSQLCVHVIDCDYICLGWASHKHKKNTKHCVDVIVLVDNGQEGYFVAGSFISPQFEIVCTKTVQKLVGGMNEDEIMLQALRLSQKVKIREPGSTTMAKSRSGGVKSKKKTTKARKKKEEQNKGRLDERCDADDACSNILEGNHVHKQMIIPCPTSQLLPEILASMKAEDIIEL